MADWWEYPNNFSGGQSVGGVGDFFMKYPNFILGNNMAMGIVLMIWVFLFITTLAVGSRKALLTSSFITFCLSLYWIAYLNPIIPVVLIVLTIVGLLGGKEETSYG